MKYLLFIILSVFLLASCITQQKCLQKFPPSSDSIYIEKLKEVPIYIDGDTIRIKVPVNCPDQDVAIYENVKLRQTIRILNGKLSSITEIKPDTIIKTVAEIHEKVKEVIIKQPEKYIPGVFKIAFWLWIGVIIAIAMYFAYKIYRPKIP